MSREDERVSLPCGVYSVIFPPHSAGERERNNTRKEQEHTWLANIIQAEETSFCYRTLLVEEVAVRSSVPNKTSPTSDIYLFISFYFR